MIDLRTPVLSSIFAVDFLFLHPRIHDERCKDTKAIFVKDFSSLSYTLFLSPSLLDHTRLCKRIYSFDEWLQKKRIPPLK